MMMKTSKMKRQCTEGMCDVMKNKRREQILFSCLGSTDPVRGLHDGAMLHIVRHYQPEKIFWYITKEMREIEKRDNRYRKAIDLLTTQQPEYHPEILEPYYDQQEDASDFDAFYEPFFEIFQKLTETYPEAEILVNVSSGTPQMKMTLALLAETLQFRAKVIQVKNFETRSGTSIRTTSKHYELEEELELNEDAVPGAKNRCSEPKLIGIQREKQKTQCRALLKRYDYAALLNTADALPTRLVPLVKHLAFRSAYDTTEAEKQAKLCKGIDLYPALAKKEPTYLEYRNLSEYLLVLQLMQKTQRYTDLVIRLNPFVIRMQEAWLEKRGVDFNCLGYRCASGEWYMDRDKIERNDPELLRMLDAKYAGGFRSSPLSISFCNCMIEKYANEDRSMAELFEKLELLNNRARNGSAHQLTNVQDEEIQNITGYDSRTLIRILISALKRIYPQHEKEELFSIYDTLNEKILSLLSEI